ncbi:TPA: hypothetical protein ACH1VU_006648 [Pseudomonas aeruginosa]|nr:hypothetical protein [Pseudomonas aeruginosa]MBG5781720.1 hypothetical protein [Pseudomonas aeruginosa]
MTRLADLEQLLAQRQAQLGDLQSCCAELAEERKAALQEASTLRQELQAAQQQWALEREDTATYVRGVEERAHREVDRAREESRGLAAQLKAVGRQHDQLRQRLDTALAQLSAAQQLAAAEKARANTLEQQFAQPLRAKRARATPAKLPRKPTVPG